MTRPVVWDVFTYHNETLLLEIRKRELADAKFDVQHLPVEASLTLTGAPREWALLDSMKMGMPPAADRWTPVQREDAMRIAAGWALSMKNAQPSDYVLFGDVDEIPTARAIEVAMSTPGIKTLRMPYHSLLATWRLPLAKDRWNFRWPVIGTFAEFTALGEGWDQIRAGSGSFERMNNCGWHLSSMGGPALVLDKVVAFAHAGESWTEGLTDDRLRDLALRGRDIADRFDQGRCPLWELPLAIVEDPEPYGVLIDVKYWS